MDRPPIELPHPVRMRVLGAVIVDVSWQRSTRRWSGRHSRRIITDLGGNDLYTWAFTAYLLTSTISGPLYGKLSDLFGRRPIFLFGIGVFMAGSLLAGLSQEMWQLVAARGVQGLGAGALFPIALAVIGDLFAPSERGRYQGLFGAVFGLSVLVGPAIGGLITDTVGWPFVFFLNLPVGAVVVAMVRRNLPLYHPAGDKPKIDYLGAALFTAALVPILVGLTNKQTADWSDPVVGGLIALGALILVAFVFVESRGGRADRAARAVPQPVVHGLGRGRVPRSLRVLRDSRVPAALVPGRRRVVGDGVGLPDAAAARRADLQRRRVRADRQPDGPLPAAHVRCARDDVDRAVHAHPPPRRHADAGPVGLDVRDRCWCRPDVRGVPAHRPEQRRDPAARDRDQQPVVLPAGRWDGRAGADAGRSSRRRSRSRCRRRSLRPASRPRSVALSRLVVVSTP